MLSMMMIHIFKEKLTMMVILMTMLVGCGVLHAVNQSS